MSHSREAPATAAEERIDAPGLFTFRRSLAAFDHPPTIQPTRVHFAEFPAFRVHDLATQKCPAARLM